MLSPSGARGRPPAAILIALFLIAALFIVSVVASLTVLQLPDPVTEQAERTNDLYQVVLAFAMAVFALVTAGLIWAVFRYRRTAPGLPEQVHGNNQLEFAWTAVPVLILVGLFIPSLILMVDLKTPPAKAEADLVVEAVGHQWFWEFVYPDQGVSVKPETIDYGEIVKSPPTLVVPTGQTVLVRVRSTDVIHSFYVPKFLYKLQAVPGTINELHFKVNKAGVYAGQCAQFCGLRHSDMLLVVDARPPAEYQRWLQEQKRAQGVAAGDAAIAIASADDGSE